MFIAVIAVAGILYAQELRTLKQTGPPFATRRAVLIKNSNQRPASRRGMEEALSDRNRSHETERRSDVCPLYHIPSYSLLTPLCGQAFRDAIRNHISLIYRLNNCSPYRIKSHRMDLEYVFWSRLDVIMDNFCDSWYILKEFTNVIGSPKRGPRLPSSSAAGPVRLIETVIRGSIRFKRVLLFPNSSKP